MTWPMSSVRLLALPAHTCLLLSWDVIGVENLRSIRTDLHRFLAAGPPPQRAGHHDIAQRMGLVATELAGNALRHGLPPVVVRLLRDADCYFLDVTDRDLHRAPEPVEACHHSRAGGRGLHLAASLTQQLCWYREDNIKHVWASFPAPPAPSEGTGL